MALQSNSLPRVAFVAALLAPGFGFAQSLDDLLRDTLEERGAYAMVAPSGQLARRMAIDLTGITPTVEDLDACEGMTPLQMHDYFLGKGPLPHTGGEDAFVWSQLLSDADHYLFSNSVQFSQVAHIREFRDKLVELYSDQLSYVEFVAWALTSQMFLNRFPSDADRANAAFFLFLGRDSLSSEVEFGRMWNGYKLRDGSIPATQAESNADYHVYDYDASLCSTGDVLCTATLWSVEGSTPEEAVAILSASPLLLEGAVERYWLRFVGTPLPGNDFPEIRELLVKGFIENDYSINWLIREIVTSIAYTQEMMYR